MGRPSSQLALWLFSVHFFSTTCHLSSSPLLWPLVVWPTTLMSSPRLLYPTRSFPNLSTLFLSKTDSTRRLLLTSSDPLPSTHPTTPRPSSTLVLSTLL